MVENVAVHAILLAWLLFQAEKELLLRVLCLSKFGLRCLGLFFTGLRCHSRPSIFDWLSGRGLEQFLASLFFRLVQVHRPTAAEQGLLEDVDLVLVFIDINDDLVDQTRQFLKSVVQWQNLLGEFLR